MSYNDYYEAAHKPDFNSLKEPQDLLDKIISYLTFAGKKR